MKIPREIEFTITVPLDEIGNDFNEMLDILQIESLAETRYLKSLINRLSAILHMNYYHLLQYVCQIVKFEKSRKDNDSSS